MEENIKVLTFFFNRRQSFTFTKLQKFTSKHQSFTLQCITSLACYWISSHFFDGFLHFSFFRVLCSCFIGFIHCHFMRFCCSHFSQFILSISYHCSCIMLSDTCLLHAVAQKGSKLGVERGQSFAHSEFAGLEWMSLQLHLRL